MLQFIRTKRKTKLNRLFYYATIRFKQYRRAFIYAYNSCFYVDLQLYDDKANTVRVDRYQVATRDYSGLLLNNKSYCKKLVKFLIFNAYEKKEFQKK